MNWIQSLRHGHSMKVFKGRAKKVSFPHAFVDFDTAKTIGFIVNISLLTAEDLIMFTKYITKLEEKGKQPVVVELNFKRKSEPMFTDTIKSIFINPEQINWLSFPSIKRLQEVNETRCDILLNLDTSERMTSRFICGLSNAKTRVGLHEEGYEGFYELMLQMPLETPLAKIMETFEMFTRMIDKSSNGVEAEAEPAQKRKKKKKRKKGSGVKKE